MRRFALVSVAALVLAGGASATTPRFAVYNLRLDLAPASHNVFGDIKVWERRSALAAHAPGATLVRCAAGCPFTHGWFAFSRAPLLGSASVAGASAARVRAAEWALKLRLTERGVARWRAAAAFLAQRQKQRGVPDVLAVVVDGSVLAAPLADQIRRSADRLELPGFTRANALRAAKLLAH